MFKIRTVLENENKAFHDVNALGLFVDNHDNPRFLYYKNSWTQFKSALTFVAFAQGIPIVYYGSEQGYAGGPDPANRETLWNTMDTQHELYHYLTNIITARKNL
jgi:alpha-amylase